MERVGTRGRCALLNHTLISPERAGATSADRPPVSVSLSDLTSTRLFWIVIMSALSGTCLVLLTVAVAVLMRRVCCYVDTDHRLRRHRHYGHQGGPHQQGSGRHQCVSLRHQRISSDCPCRRSSPLSELPAAADTDEHSDDLAASTCCNTTEV